MISPPLDPGTDILAGVGREIPASVRDWALTAERHPGGTYPPPAWVMEELLTFGGQSLPDPPDQWLDYLGFPPAPGTDRGAGEVSRPPGRITSRSAMRVTAKRCCFRTVPCLRIG